MKKDVTEVSLRELVVALRNEVRELASGQSQSSQSPAVVDEPNAPLWRTWNQVGGAALAEQLGEIIAERDLREKFFDKNYCQGASWNILVDLARARARQESISVSSACIASRGPMTTALRYLAELVEDGLVVRIPDAIDKRRQWVSLSDDTYRAMCGYLQARQERRGF